jgi:hypothetical protein
MRKEFNNLVELLSNLQLPSPIGMAIMNLEHKIDEVEKRIECARRSAKEINDSISKYTQRVDDQESFVMTVDSHDSIQNGSNDVLIALDLNEDMCVEDNWYNLFSTKEELKPIAVGRIEYEFPEDVYTIGNADNTEMIGDVYESEFVELCELGLIWCEGDERFPNGDGNKANYVVRNNEFIIVVKNKQIDLTKVPIKQEVFMTDEAPTMLCKDKHKNEVVQDIIAKLKEIEVDGETMEYILDQVGMLDQVAKQLGLVNF